MNYLDLAVKAAKEAGRIHKKYFRGNYKLKTKSASFDLVTCADTEAEKAVVSLIRKHFPEHNFLAEENKYPKTGSEYTWVIDPLDGTNNFACGLPIFCSSVALVCNGRTIAGAIYDMTRDELFYAAKGKRAFLNGKPIRVNNADTIKKALLITGFYYSRGKETVETLGAVKRFLFRNVLGIRRLGAAALDLCYVACGRAAGYWEHELSPWDFAAGKLIVEEAGGKVSGRNLENIPWDKKHFIVASNGKVHRRMLSVINRNLR
jgi:myo-inositol-1(or 4)-monophosphatase